MEYAEGMRDFKRLEIWRRAHALAIALHELAADYGRLGVRDLKLMSQDNWSRYSTETIEIRRMTFGYRKRVLEDELE